MTKDQLKGLERGDIVRHVGGDVSYVVTGNYGDRVTAVNTVDITRAAAWELVFKATHANTRETLPLPNFARVIVKHEHKYLVLQERRGEETSWSFPGGRCEPGESHEQTVRRETREETGLEVHHMTPIIQGVFEFAGVRWHGAFFLATRVEGLPRIMEPERCQSVQFVREDHLQGLPGIVREPLCFAAVRDLESSFGPAGPHG